MYTMAVYQLPLTVIFITELVIPLADGEIHRTTLKTGAPNRFSQDVAWQVKLDPRCRILRLRERFMKCCSFLLVALYS